MYKKEFDMIDAYYSELAHAKAQIPKLLVVFPLFVGVVCLLVYFINF